MTPCDNISKCHDLVFVAEDESASRVICKECKHQYVIRKDWRGIHENRQYSKVYKRDVLQGSDNLLYKYHPEFLRT